MPRNTETVANTPLYAHNNQKFGYSLRPPRGGQGRTYFLIDSHPHSHETFIFTLGAPYEETCAG